MQIGGNYNSNYNSYSNNAYNYAAHTHHFTECLHEEQISKKQVSGAEAVNGVSLEIQGHQTEKISEMPAGGQGSVWNVFWKKRLGFMQGLWDAMGKDSSQQSDSASVFETGDPASGKGLLRGVNAMISVIKQGFNVQVIERFEVVREKIKVGIHTALKRFGKGSEPFGTLTDSGTGSLLGGRTGSGASGRRDRSGTRQRQGEEIKTAPMANEHLMDSYSKSGTYCKLNENLTYSQGRAPYRVSEQSMQHGKEDSF